ncbi:hypothetical protein LCGC14_1267170 [marine sediment metagenome]|uniref:Uncharacterized protein n=1 Tax=marine sediment metagenome TaxID=412755 RepID=A0A0F9NFR9_9ZZZZ
MLLNDDEIDTLPDLKGNEGYDTFCRRCDKQIAKAQVKKMVEWLEIELPDIVACIRNSTKANGRVIHIRRGKW